MLCIYGIWILHDIGRIDGEDEMCIRDRSMGKGLTGFCQCQKIRVYDYSPSDVSSVSVSVLS